MRNLKPPPKLLRVLSYLLVGAFGLWMGYLAAAGSSYHVTLVRMNERLAHQFYFALDALEELEHIESLDQAERESLSAGINKLCDILELSYPYVTFPTVYGDDLTIEQVDRLRRGLQDI